MGRPAKKAFNKEAFLRDLHKSENTQRTYRHALSQFEKFLDGRPPTEDEARSYIRHLVEKGLASSSIGTHGHSLRHYYKWSRIPLDLELPAARRKLAPWLGMDDIQKLLNACKHPLETALVMVLFDTAIRANELIGLTTQDIDWERGFIYIRRKGGREEWTPIGADALEALKTYLKRRKNKSKRVFPFSYFELRGFIMELGERAKVMPRDRKNLTLHCFRHARAAVLREDNVPIEDISSLLGHARLETTMIYAQIKPQTLKDRIPAPAFKKEGK